MNMRHMDYLNCVVNEDISELKRKEATYQGSWKKRGGVGAYFVTVRKIDRMEVIVKDNGYDIFAALSKDMSGADGTLLAEVRDLRRYLLLIEAEMVARRAAMLAERPGAPTDGGHHARNARLLDGLTHTQIDLAFYNCYMPTVDGLFIVDRRRVSSEDWDHLPRFPVELNHVEHRELPPEYQGLYTWLEIPTKWQMKSEFREHWAKQ